MRNILIGLGVLVAIVIGAAVFLVNNLDSLVETAIEKGGTRATGTAVEVGGVSVSLSDASATIRDFSVANPDGFKTDTAIAFDEVTVQLNLEKTNDKLVYINLAKIIGPTVTYEGSGPRGKSNVDEILENVDRLAKQAEALSGGSSSSEEAGSSPDVAIEKLIIEKTTVQASVARLDPFELELGGMEMNNIGTSGDGAGPAEVMDVYLSRVVPAVVTAVTKKSTELLKDMGGAAGKAVEGALQGAGDVTKGVGDLTKGVSEGLGGAADGAAEGVGNAVKGLFGQ